MRWVEIRPVDLKSETGIMGSTIREAAVATHYQRVLEQIERAALSAGRKPEDVNLVVVTKGHPVEMARAAVRAGAHALGENYVEEAIPKIQVLSAQAEITWHMIGHIQSRKARQVCEHFAWVHSLDRVKLAVRLDRFAGELERKLFVLLECNVSGEETKFGLAAWQEEYWEKLLPDLAQILDLPHLQVRGLMTMAPFLPDPEEARPYFRRLRRLRDFLAHHLPQGEWQELSMGMSADFEVAVQEGATFVRVGQAILGPRPG